MLRLHLLIKPAKLSFSSSKPRSSESSARLGNANRSIVPSCGIPLSQVLMQRSINNFLRLGRLLMIFTRDRVNCGSHVPGKYWSSIQIVRSEAQHEGPSTLKNAGKSDRFDTRHVVLENKTGKASQRTCREVRRIGLERACLREAIVWCTLAVMSTCLKL